MNTENTTNEDNTLRMYAIARGDLGMTPGKLAAQAGHAFKLLTKEILTNSQYTNLADEYFSDGCGTNVVLKAKSINHIYRALEEAQQAGIPCSLVIDEHHIIPGTPFDGSPIVTALGLGPATREQIQHITKRFSCIQ